MVRRGETANEASLAISAQRSYCSVEHNVRRRVATLLLTIAPEGARTDIPATHELIAQMVSIRRPSVSLVLSDLQRLGAVRNSHPQVAIVDRALLMEAACPCFATRSRILSRVSEGGP